MGMSFSPVLIFHISAGALGLVSGAVALIFLKGSRRHRVAGTVFFAATMSMAASALYLALEKRQWETCLVALLTAYLVASAWRTARRRDGGGGAFEVGSFLLALALGAGFVVIAAEMASQPSASRTAVKYLLFGVVALFAAAGDLRLLLRGGVSGRQRIARHLWRMTCPLLIAANIFFQGQAKLFPDGVRRAHVLYLPILLIMGATAFWIVRVLFPRTDRGRWATLHSLRT